MKKIAVVTVGRSDYGIYRPLLQKIQDDNDLELMLFAGGEHLDPDSGSLDDIEKDGFSATAVVDCSVQGDSPLDASDAMARGVKGFAALYDELQPDIAVVLGDRFEMFSAAAAAAPLLLPVAHIHGGEVTSGAIDELFRHAMTKMSHLHFVSTDLSARRLSQMGEEEWRITVSGAPGLDNIPSIRWMDLPALESLLEISLEEKPLLVTYHPVTLEYPGAAEQVREVLSALSGCERPQVITAPNRDPEHNAIYDAIEEYAETRTDVRVVRNLGTSAYFSLMKHGAAMIGNSSSGIIEAASFELPVLNIGNRQEGRERPPNVVDVPCVKDEIEDGLKKVLSSDFSASLDGMKNIYGDGRASERICRVLKETEPGGKLIKKRFMDG